MTAYIIVHNKKYPKSLIDYLLKKYKGKTPEDLPEKYLDEMKQVIKDGFEDGVINGRLYTFYPDMIPIWQDIAEAKGYVLSNIKHNQNADTYQADVTKLENRKPKKKVIKSRRRKK